MTAFYNKHLSHDKIVHMYFHKTISDKELLIRNAYLKFWTNSKRQSSEYRDSILEWKKKNHLSWVHIYKSMEH